MSVDAILKEVEALTADERAELMSKLEERFPQLEESADLTPAQIAELERRLAAYRADPDNVIPWEVVKAQATARAKQ